MDRAWRARLLINGNNTDNPQRSPMIQFILGILPQVLSNMTYTPYNLTDTLPNVSEPLHTTQVAFNLTTQPTTEISGFDLSTLIVIVGGVLLSVLTTLGNLMVMVSFKIDRQLQTISNYFLLSLAVADITIGFISIPLMTLYTAQGRWTLGYNMCQFWLCVDYLMSNASVLNLLLISFDRYFSVTRPLTYRPRRTPKKASIMIASTYIISLILWPPWIISWPHIEGEFTVDSSVCMVQFFYTNAPVTVGTAVAAFYLPVTIMVILYSRVYWETQKRQRELCKLQAFQHRSSRYKISRDENETSTSVRMRSTRLVDMTSTSSMRSTRVANQLDTTPSPQTSSGLTRQSSKVRFSGRFKKRRPSSLSAWLSRCFRTSTSEDTHKASQSASVYDEMDSSSECAARMENAPLNAVNADETPSMASSVFIEPENTGYLTPTYSLRKKSRGRRRKSNDEGSVDMDMAPETAPMLPSQNSAPAGYRRVEVVQPPRRPDKPARVYTVLIQLDSLSSQSTAVDSPRTFSSSGTENAKFMGKTQVSSLASDSSRVAWRPPPTVNMYDGYDSTTTATTATTCTVTSVAIDETDPMDSPSSLLHVPSVKRNRSLSDAGSNEVPASKTEELRKIAMQNMRQKTSPDLTERQKIDSDSSASGKQLLRTPTNQSKKKEKEKRKARQSEKKQESKAAKTLSAILLAFVLTWTPYNLIVCIWSVTKYEFPEILWTLSYYLCYINSTVNPLCYALCNATFRSTYIRILKCKWKSRRGPHGTSGFITR